MHACASVDVKGSGKIKLYFFLGGEKKFPSFSQPIFLRVCLSSQPISLHYSAQINLLMLLVRAQEWWHEIRWIDFALSGGKFFCTPISLRPPLAFAMLRCLSRWRDETKTSSGIKFLNYHHHAVTSLCHIPSHFTSRQLSLGKKGNFSFRDQIFIELF